MDPHQEKNICHPLFKNFFFLKLKVNFEYNLKGGNLIISVQPFISMGGERGSKGF